MRVWSSNRGPVGMLARFLFVAFAYFGGFIVLGATLFFGLGYFVEIGKCHFNVVESRPSPSAKRVVIVYNNVCNDVYRVTTQASLATGVGTLKESPEEAFFSAIDIDDRAVIFNWLDENRLTVEIRDNIEIEKALLRAGDVEIEYR